MGINFLSRWDQEKSKGKGQWTLVLYANWLFVGAEGGVELQTRKLFHKSMSWEGEIPKMETTEGGDRLGPTRGQVRSVHLGGIVGGDTGSGGEFRFQTNREMNHEQQAERAFRLGTEAKGPESFQCKSQNPQGFRCGTVTELKGERRDIPLLG